MFLFEKMKRPWRYHGRYYCRTNSGCSARSRMRNNFGRNSHSLDRVIWYRARYTARAVEASHSLTLFTRVACARATGESNFWRSIGSPTSAFVLWALRYSLICWHSETKSYNNSAVGKILATKITNYSLTLARRIIHFFNLNSQSTRARYLFII